MAYLSEDKGFERKKAVILTSAIMVRIGLLATLSADEFSLLGNVPVFGKRFFDLFDFASSNILLPAGGLLIAIFIGHFTKKEDLKYELSNRGVLKMEGVIGINYFIVKYITPILLVIVFLNSIGIIKIK